MGNLGMYTKYCFDCEQVFLEDYNFCPHCKRELDVLKVDLNQYPWLLKRDKKEEKGGLNGARDHKTV